MVSLICLFIHDYPLPALSWTCRFPCFSRPATLDRYTDAELRVRSNLELPLRFAAISATAILRARSLTKPLCPAPLIEPLLPHVTRSLALVSLAPFSRLRAVVEITASPRLLNRPLVLDVFTRAAGIVKPRLSDLELLRRGWNTSRHPSLPRILT